MTYTTLTASSNPFRESTTQELRRAATSSDALRFGSFRTGVARAFGAFRTGAAFGALRPALLGEAFGLGLGVALGLAGLASCEL